MLSVAEIIKKSDKDLLADLHDLKQEQMNLRFQKVSRKLESTSRVRVVRRQIARVKTVLSARQREGVQKNAAA